MKNNEDLEFKKSKLVTNLLNSINSNYKLCVIYAEDLINICNEAKKKGLILPVDVIDNYLDELDLIENDLNEIKPNDIVDDNKINIYFELNNKICNLNNSILSLIDSYINQYLDFAKENNIELTSYLINNVPNYGIKNKLENNNCKSKR